MILRVLREFAWFLIAKVKRACHRQRIRHSLRRSEWIFFPLIEEASRKADGKQLKDLHGELYATTRWERETLDSMASVDLLGRARRLHIDLDDIPLPNGQGSHWTGNGGNLFLDPRSMKSLSKLVSDEERKRRNETFDRVLKIGTFLAALVAAANAVITWIPK